MPESGERRGARAPQNMGGGQPPHSDQQLPCPRCDSTNTKFCYYNNYNLSQPRHFCKSCRRYWTQGGTLRNIPVGGGTRKNSKRSRLATTDNSPPANPISLSPVMKAEAETPPPPPPQPHLSLGDVPGGFTSLLNSQGPGFLALNGFGLGLGPGFEEMGFGAPKGVWCYPDVGDVVVGDGGGGSGSGDGSASSSLCNTWQLSGGEVGFVDGDCFAWPDLAISMPGQGLK